MFKGNIIWFYAHLHFSALSCMSEKKEHSLSLKYPSQKVYVQLSMFTLYSIAQETLAKETEIHRPWKKQLVCKVVKDRHRNTNIYIIKQTKQISKNLLTGDS